jgi:hypothetical protein
MQFLLYTLGMQKLSAELHSSELSALVLALSFHPPVCCISSENTKKPFIGLPVYKKQYNWEEMHRASYVEGNAASVPSL